MEPRGRTEHREIPGDRLRMQGMPRMGEGDQGIDVQQVSHGKSSRAARTSSLVTLASTGDCVMRNPDLGSSTRRGRSVTEYSGVSTIERPCTLQANVVPGRRCKRAR